MSKLTKAKSSQLQGRLLEEYADAKCELDYDTPFHLLVAVVLSAQTTDVSVNKVTPALFKAAPDAAALAALSEEEIQDFIRSIGLYKSKAKNIRGLSQKIAEEYGGEVPGDFEKLTALPGVGRKTANVVLAECFQVPSIAVDTHVFRLANKMGLTDADDVLDTELQLQKAIPKENWIKMHHALIWHGRRVCFARNPNCGGCCVNDICKRNEREKK